MGIVGNVFSLTVWCMETSFHVTVFLFKVLAVVDIVYLASAVCYADLTSFYNFAARVACFFSGYAQMMSVYVTLLIGVSRWIAVTFPFRAQRLMTSYRIYVSCAVIMVLGGIFQAGRFYFYFEDYDNFDNYLIVRQTVGFILPLLLLLMFNASLLWTATRRPRIIPVETMKKIQLSANLQVKNISLQTCECVALHSKEVTGHEDETYDGTEAHTSEDHPQQTHLQSQWQQQSEHVEDSVMKSKTDVIDHSEQTFIQRLRKRKLVLAVLLVSLCSFIAYPFNTTLVLSFKAKGVFLTTAGKAMFRFFTQACQVLNSSINVFIYWFFVSRFKQLAKKLKTRLCACSHCAREAT